ncbi:MAG: flippase [Planctomycetota bacterium]
MSCEEPAIETQISEAVRAETKITAVGSIYAFSSRIIFLACGFITHLFLARRLGPEIYGLYGFIMSILIWVEFAVLEGIPSTYRKVISEDENMTVSALRSIWSLFAPYCLVIMAVFLLITPLISTVFDDKRLLLLLLIAGIDIPFYGIFYAYSGVLNGLRQFFKENVSRSAYTLSRTIFVILPVLLGLGLRGVLVGNIMASFLGAMLALFFVKVVYHPADKGETFNLKPRIINFGLPYLLYVLAAMLLTSMGMWFVKGLLKDDMMTGYYSAAYNISRIHFFLITGLIAVMFPSFSKAVSEGDISLSKRYIKQAMRIALVILLPINVIIFCSSGELISLLFGSRYLSASTPLQILFLGMSFFSVFSLLSNMIAAENKPFRSLAISLSLVPVAIALNYFLINSYGINGAAVATTLTCGIGVVATGVYIGKRFGAILSLATLLRVALASGCLYVVSKYMVTEGYYLVPVYILLFVIYLVLLVLLREINSGDIEIVKDVCYSLWKRPQISANKLH